MALNLEKLSSFDLEKDLEKRIFEEVALRERFIAFLGTINEIQAVERFISDCPSFPDSTDNIMKHELRSAIGATLAIEGTVLSDEEIKESFQQATLQRTLEKKQQEAENTRKAYQYITKLVDKHEGLFIYREEHIKQIHQYLTDDIQYVSPNVPGQYRDTKAMFGEPRKISFCKSKADIENIMPKFIDWLNTVGSGCLMGDDIVKAIMAHYYLTEIHPFGDGNGRTARALEALVLYATRKRPYSYRALAKFWNANRNEYVAHLGNIRSTCDPWDLLIWGIEGYLDETKRIKGLVLKKLKELMLQDYVRWLHFDAKKIRPRVFGVLIFLISSGKMPFDKFMSTPEMGILYNKRSVSTKYKDIRKIEKELGLIRFSKENSKKFIEPNYQKLEEVSYIT